MVNRVLENPVKSEKGKGEPATLAQWLEQRCKDEKLSYRQAARKGGVSHATIASIRKGARPSAATVVKLAKAFGNDGNNQKAALEDHLLSLCGYRSERTAPVLSEPLARLLDKLSHFSEEQLKAIEHIIEFSVSLGNKSWRGQNR